MEIVMTTKSSDTKILISLQLKLIDALKMLEWLHEHKMIDDSTYAIEGQRVMAEHQLVRKTAEKDD